MLRIVIVELDYVFCFCGSMFSDFCLGLSFTCTFQGECRFLGGCFGLLGVVY